MKKDKKVKEKQTEKEEIFIDGKVESPRTINDILGISKKKYDTADADEYREILNKMNLSELHEHGVKVAQIRPNSDRRRMENSLVKEFNKYWVYVESALQTPKANQKPLSKAFQKLMGPR